MNSHLGAPLARAAVASVLAIAAALGATSASAQEYPNKPVKIIVPFAPGGSADVYGRAVAVHLQEVMKQTFIVENRPGAGSLIGTEAVAKSAPDGYTLLLMSNTHTVNESLFTTKSFDLMRDFVPIAPINYSDLVLVARPGLGANNIADLLKMAKAKPGSLSYASSGPGTPYHMAGELFKTTAGVSILHIPYKGSSNARTDVLGGQVDLMFDAVPTMAEFIRSGKVTALATTGKTRSEVLSNVPTMNEAGVPGYEAVIWLGLMAPKGTPPAIVARLNEEVGKFVSEPQTVQAWAKQGTTPMKMTPTAFSKFMQDDITKWAQVVKVSGAKADR
jgi:tripartite-type tricarboxylate transporter receptor subunit TctC